MGPDSALKVRLKNGAEPAAVLLPVRFVVPLLTVRFGRAEAARAGEDFCIGSGAG